MRKTTFSAIVPGILLLISCAQVSVPSQYEESAQLPKIYPDYTEVTIPVNIAPLTFELDEAADDMVARYEAGGIEVLCQEQMTPSLNEWHQLTQAAKGKEINVDVYAQKGGRWIHYKPFGIKVSADSIDPYISYRLIAPSFVTYESLTINQRCLENYEEDVIYDNILCSFEKSGQCINCHHYQQYNPDRMQFHARQNHGGTVIAYDGQISKINMANDSILSAGVYPAWHPTLPFIVYSTDKTHQSFFTMDPNKVEVFDAASDIIAYDIEKNTVTNLENADDELEVFPAWAPDGKTLYYCSAHFEREDTTKSQKVEVLSKVGELRYNIYKKTFDPSTRTFGPRELVYDATAAGQSATLPRVSPDGRFLIFTSGSYGYFHIWHHDADLWMLDLQTSEVRPLSEINSSDTESYHSWSSNGRWVIFSSRRDDGNYTRPFIAHIDAQGHGSKPFELPSAYPDYHRQLMRSYNIPEFMRGPVTIRPQQFADVLKGEAQTATYESK